MSNKINIKRELIAWLVVFSVIVAAILSGCGKNKSGTELTGAHSNSNNSNSTNYKMFQVVADPEKGTMLIQRLSSAQGGGSLQFLTDVASDTAESNFVFAGGATFVAKNASPPALCNGLACGGKIASDTLRANVFYTNKAAFPIYDTKVFFFSFTNSGSLDSNSGGYLASITATSTQLAPNTQTKSGIDMGDALAGGNSNTKLWIYSVPSGVSHGSFLLLEYRWRAQVSGTGNQLFAVDFTDANNGWAAGVAGTILHTADGGATWAAQASGTAMDLYDIQMVSSSVGFVCGDAGTVLTTANGGTTWTPTGPAIGNILLGLHFTSANVGWVVGSAGVIEKTKNGGGSWAAQASGTANALAEVYCASGNDCWAVGAGGVITATTNSGKNWNLQASGTVNDLSGIYCTDSSNCWVAGNGGTILNTANGGTNWNAQASGVGVFLAMPAFEDVNTGWVVGNGGTVLRTTNGGATWSAQDSGTGSCLNGVKIGVDANNNRQIWSAGCNGVMQTYK